MMQTIINKVPKNITQAAKQHNTIESSFVAQLTSLAPHILAIKRWRKQPSTPRNYFAGSRSRVQGTYMFFASLEFSLHEIPSIDCLPGLTLCPQEPRHTHVASTCPPTPHMAAIPASGSLLHTWPPSRPSTLHLDIPASCCCPTYVRRRPGRVLLLASDPSSCHCAIAPYCMQQAVAD
jgi:hypothetical protein